MSRYVIKLDALSTIVAEDIDLASDFCDIVFAHKLNGKDRIEMKGLSFGFTLVKDGSVVHEFTYPRTGVKLLRSDQKYICVERVEWIPNALYTIDFWFQNEGQDKISKTRDFLSPKGTAPGKKWQWNDIKKTYEEPSIPYPDIHFELRKPMLSSLVRREG
jgi:hypothetical protein